MDKRADIWSFGCVLYETLTARRAFEGETAADCIAAILEHEPSWSTLPPDTPAPARQLLRRCLEKDSNRRLRDAGDARLEIEDALADLPMAPARSGFSSHLQPVGSLLGSRRAPLEPPVLRLTQITFSEQVEEFPAWGPSGDHIAFARVSGSVRKIFVKKLSTGEESSGTRGDFDDIQPNWSPDGRKILFVRAQEPGRRLEPGDIFGQYGGADIWLLELDTGREARLVVGAANPVFSPDGGRMAFDAARAGPWRIWTADARGRNPEQATSDSSEAVVHVRPRWSPDGAKIVFQNVERTKFDVRVVDLASKKMTWVTNDQTQDVCPVWSPSGGCIYFSSYRSGGLNVWRVPVDSDGRPAGPLQQLTTGAGQDVEVAISRDGQRLAFSILRQNADLWRLPVEPLTGRAAGPPEKVVTTTREDSRGGWSPDSQAIVFNSDRAGHMNIWWQSLQNGSTRPLTKGPGGDFQGRFSPDGRRVVFFSSRGGAVDIWKVEARTGELDQLTGGHSIDVNPVYSPDGRWIAWMSDRGGRSEVWVMDAEGGSARALTDVGVMGHFLAWMPDGESIVFRCPSGGAPVMRVSAKGGEPEPLAEVAGGSHVSLAPDGSRIMDVVAHKALWVSPLADGRPEKIFEFDDPDVRIDYPVWSPDGRWVLFDRFRPQGGDIWMMEGLEQ